MNTVSTYAGDFPIVLSRPVQREDLKRLSPLVVGGWDELKSKRVAAWLNKIGNSADPWTLVLRVDDDVALFSSFYYPLEPGWNVLINQEPPDDTTPRVYVFEDVWYFEGSIARPPKAADILALADTWPVIIVPDPEGMLPDYLEPTRQMTKQFSRRTDSVMAWAQSSLSPFRELDSLPELLVLEPAKSLKEVLRDKSLLNDQSQAD